MGAPHQLIGRDLIESQTGRTIGFVEWVTMFLPIVLVMFVVLAVLLLLLNRPEVTRLEGAAEFVAEQRVALGGVTRGEKNTVVAFGVAVVLWTTPGVLGAVIGEDTAPVLWLTEHVTEESRPSSRPPCCSSCRRGPRTVVASSRRSPGPRR